MPANTHAGAAFQAALHLPREYRALLALEGATVAQLDPGQPFDQWRLALAGGYSALPDPTGRLGYEVTGRAGFLRGSSGPAAATGFFGGLRFGLPILLGARKEPWQAEDVAAIQVMLVPEIGFNAVRPSHQDWQWEPAALLGLRLHFTSGLLP
ncbi:MAG TPA: hypothetical protein VFL36_07470 [Myxococcales bacterium]|nr:hypothetical protein [Myxococcales bacterium]